MRLVLVCNAEAGDDGLSEHGRRQALGIASEIVALSGRTFSVEGVYSTPEAETRATADVIATTLGVGPYQVDDAFSGGSEAESPEAMQERAWAAIDALREEHSQDSVLVLVGQELPIRTLVCSALSIPLPEMYRFRIDPASMTTLEFRSQPQRRTILAGLNETCHLDD